MCRNSHANGAAPRCGHCGRRSAIRAGGEERRGEIGCTRNDGSQTIWYGPAHRLQMKMRKLQPEPTLMSTTHQSRVRLIWIDVRRPIMEAKRTCSRITAASLFRPTLNAPNASTSARSAAYQRRKAANAKRVDTRKRVMTHTQTSALSANGLRNRLVKHSFFVGVIEMLFSTDYVANPVSIPVNLQQICCENITIFVRTYNRQRCPQK